LLFIIYTINLPVVRPRSCRIIYYFDTPAFGRRHQSFGRVTGTVVALAVQPERTSSMWSRDSLLLQENQPTETPLKILARSNGRIKSYRPFGAGTLVVSVDGPMDIVDVQ